MNSNFFEIGIQNARLRQNLVLPGTSVKFKITRGATLIHGSTRALAEYLHIPGN